MKTLSVDDQSSWKPNLHADVQLNLILETMHIYVPRIATKNRNVAKSMNKEIAANLSI